MAAKVSIIIPIYNTEKYLVRCMDSVLGQTLKEIEIILVDDQSPDNAPAMCDEYALSDSRIRVIHKKNGGLGLARNSGLEIATGEYVAFLDSDDYISTDMYEKLYCCASQNKADTCFCGCRVDFGNGTYENIPFPLGAVQYSGNDEVVSNVLLNALGAEYSSSSENLLGMQVWRGLYSNCLIQKHSIKFCSERDYICEDAIFHIDYFRYSEKFVSISDCCYSYCVYGESLSRCYRADRFDKNIIFFREEVRRLKEYHLYDKARIYVERMFLALIRGNIRDAVHHLDGKDGLKAIREFAGNPIVQEVLEEYDYRRNPIKTSLLNFLIHKKAAATIYMIYKFMK